MPEITLEMENLMNKVVDLNHDVEDEDEGQEQQKLD